MFLIVLGGTQFNEVIEQNEVIGNYFMEAMVIADDSVVDFHGRQNIEKYLLTMMNIVSVIQCSKSDFAF